MAWPSVLWVSAPPSLASLDASADYFASNQRKSSIGQIIRSRWRFYVVFTKNVPLTARWGYPEAPRGQSLPEDPNFHFAPGGPILLETLSADDWAASALTQNYLEPEAMPRDAHYSADNASLGGGAPAKSGRWTIVFLLFTASVINYLDRSSISLALPLLSRDLGLGPESKGLLLSAFFWFYALLQIPVGWAADRVNLRWLYFSAFVLWSVSQGLTGFRRQPYGADHVSHAAGCR